MGRMTRPDAYSPEYWALSDLYWAERAHERHERRVWLLLAAVFVALVLIAVVSGKG